MAEIESERSSTGLAFVVGGLIVAVAAMGYLLFGGKPPATDDVDVTITLPKVDVN
jgi:hypothetical protein